MDLMAPMRLAGRNLLSSLCPTQNYLPYWQMELSNEYRGAFRFREGCNAHNIGRWWDAMLRLDDAVGFPIPPEVEAAMMRNLRRYCDNPWGILLDVTDDPDDAAGWYIHSFRETMLALYCLVRFRDDPWAAEAGRRAVRAMGRASGDLSRWDFSPTPQPRCNRAPPVYTHGRALEGLVLFHQATGDEAVLDDAGRVARYHRENTTRPDGSLAEDNSNHTHSYLNTLRGLLLYGRLTGRREYVEAVRATYRETVRAMLTPSGFITHDIDTASFAAGEAASAGDAAQIALWLHQDGGDGDLLDDVERLVRARLVPSQITAAPPIEPQEQSDRDECRDLSGRIVGALGGCVGHTAGKSCITDITAASLHSLIDIYQNIVTRDETGVRVNLHFDCDSEFAQVRSERGERARLEVTVPGGEAVFIRVPGWAPRQSVGLKVNGGESECRFEGSYVHVPPAGLRARIEMSYDLPERVTVETSCSQYFDSSERLRAPSPEPREYTLHWRGDDVVGASPAGDYFPLYPRAG